MLASNHLIGFGAAVDTIVESVVTWNPSDKDAGITLSNGDLDADGNVAAFRAVRATIGKSSGKYYFELLINTITSSGVVSGVLNSTAALTTYVGNAASGRGVQSSGTSYATGFTAGSSCGAFSATQVLGICFDMGTGKVFIAINNTWQGSSDPVAQTNPWATGLSGTVYAAHSASNAGNRATLRTKLADFTYSPPSGYSSYASP